MTKKSSPKPEPTVNFVIVRRNATTITGQATGWKAAYARIAEFTKEADMAFYKLQPTDTVIMAEEDGKQGTSTYSLSEAASCATEGGR